MTLLVSLLSLTMLAQTLRMAVPYVCAGLGGVWSERSGVVNIALEGILLAGGLGGVVAHVATGSAWAGVLAGALVGAGIGLGHALIVVRGRVDAIVSGIAINLAAAGGTRFANTNRFADTPRLSASSANWTIRMPFFETSPTSVTRPTRE